VARLVDCGVVPPDLSKGPKVSSWSLSADGPKLNDNIHILFHLSAWTSLADYKAGQQAKQQDVIFHIVTKLPFKTVLKSFTFVLLR
jgi:hypothetical protein